ncbi:class II core domain (G, H, P, S and T) tRNA synthetase, partial [Helicosporidium sp. ATCC 50920]
MASNHAELETQLREKEQASARQGDEVRALKAKFKEGLVTKGEVDAAVELLKNLKIEAAQFQKEYEAATGSGTREAFRQNVLNALERRLFFIPSFKIYGSVAGLYDYGPPGCGIKANVTQAWRQHFVLEEGMLEVECPAVTPAAVLKASGHVDRFVDYMVSDKATGECHRADHLLEAELERVIADAKTEAGSRREAQDLLARVGELGAEALGEALVKYDIRSPDTGNELSAPFAFNLMFKTQIGPRGDATGYLRPETAQGIFVNFRDLLYYAGSKLPFAAAQIGSSYRNEISPRSGLLRVREFTQAEIEHFVNPSDKRHPKFARVAEVSPLLYSRDLQLGEEKAAKRLALGEAVARGVIANETLAYFIGRTALFCERIGLDPERVRFRQHLQHEMAHYAEDCWDCEVECSYGWIECAGLADRSAYDLNAHAAAAKVDLTAYETFPEPRDVEELRIVPDKKKLGQLFRKDAAAVMQALEGLCEPTALALRDALARGEEGALKLGDGRSVALPPGSVDIEKLTV